MHKIRNGEIIYLNNNNSLLNINSSNGDNKKIRNEITNLQNDEIINEIDDESYTSNRIEVNKKKKSTFHLPLGERWINALQYLKRELGICTMFDVMINKQAALAIHFDENEYMQLEGIWDEDTKKWKTECATWDRLCEVIAKYLVAHNLVDANFTWKDLSNATLAVNMHEG